MNIRIVTASAGTGKTTRLAQLLDEAVGSGRVRPEAILATTFTKQAAAELLNRARTRLLQSGHGQHAQSLLTARIGTVNAVCGSLVAEFSFELGLSPELRVLDEAGAELSLKRALATVVTDEVSDRLQTFQGKFDFKFDWHYEVRRLIEAARANGLDGDRFAESAERSVAALDACLGPAAEAVDDLDGALRAAIDAALAAIRASADSTKGTANYCELLEGARSDLDRGRLRWGDWARLSSKAPTKKSLEHAVPVQDAAARHLGHPRLREELCELIRLMFDVAGAGLRAYQDHKRDHGVLDFVDQEVHALELLSRPEIREALAHEFDLVLVDEFQDTSPLQLAIFLKLAGLAKESVWVGDPKQAIYGFRGTDPALMDAAIESLSSPSQDADLVAAAVGEISGKAPVETLSRSYRSRPELVELTNAVFGSAFLQQQAMPVERVRLDAQRQETRGLGAAVTYLPLSCGGRANKRLRSRALAAGLRELLAGTPAVWDRAAETLRDAKASDLAVLCRTNEQCQDVSEALGQLGISSVIARVGLRETAEAQVVLAGLRLWIDGRDRLAAATLVRILEHPEDPAAFLEKALVESADDGLFRNTAVQALLAAREATRDLGVRAVMDAVLDVLGLRLLCAEWGDSAQRLANLDALRAHASRYEEECRAVGEATSAVGFLGYFEELATTSMWGGIRRDSVARVGSENAVTVSTWHASKGLEWPVVALYGLETLRAPNAYGVHVLSDRATFDVDDPLGGRWIHFWPNPYTTSNQGGPVKDAYERSAAHRHIEAQAQREALRVLYVGWTRARDRVVLAAESGKLLDGLLGTLSQIDPTIISEPAGEAAGSVPTSWAGHDFEVQVCPSQPVDEVPRQREAGSVRVGCEPVERVPATLAPSSAPPMAGVLGDPVRLGEPVRIRASVEVDALGVSVHAFFSADDPERDDRLEVAEGLLNRYDVRAALEPSELLELADRLWHWVAREFGAGARVYSEWPVGMRLDSGTRMSGVADLVIESADAIAVVDHKSMGLAAATRQADVLAGQLGCYADALMLARPGKPVSKWLHLPFDGMAVELK